MTAPNAPTNGPTPNSMPGAATNAPGTGPADNDPDSTTDDDGDAGDGGDELSYEQLQAEMEKWKNQARKNEDRAKKNAQKAKEFDTVASTEWKAAYEREQAAKNASKTPEQIRAEAEADAKRIVDEALAAKRAAEAEALRYKLADGKVPSWAMGLIDGTDEDSINEQIGSLTTNLAAYVKAELEKLGAGDPRKPAPNPLAGRTNGVGTGPREAFAATMQGLLQ